MGNIEHKEDIQGPTNTNWKDWGFKDRGNEGTKETHLGSN